MTQPSTLHWSLAPASALPAPSENTEQETDKENRIFSIKPRLLLLKLTKKVTAQLWKVRLFLFCFQSEGSSWDFVLRSLYIAGQNCAAEPRHKTTFLRCEAAAAAALAKPNTWHLTPEKKTQDTFVGTSKPNVIKTYAQVFLSAHQEQLDSCGVVLLQRVFQPLPADRKRRLYTNCKTPNGQLKMYTLTSRGKKSQYHWHQMWWSPLKQKIHESKVFVRSWSI